MKSFDTYLFDWDACLARTFDAWLIVFKETLLEYDIKPTDEEIVKNMFGDWQGATKMGVDEEENGKFYERAQVRLDKMLMDIELYNGAREVLEVLKKQDKTIALVSTSNKEALFPVLDNLDMRKYFDFIVCGDDTQKHKPDPEPLNLALDQLASDRDSAVMIGDSYKDVLAAKAAGISSILFLPEENKKYYDFEELLKSEPDYAIDKLIKIFE